MRTCKMIVFTTTLCLSACAIENVDVADRFALDYQATEFSNHIGAKRHVCEILWSQGWNTCWGLLDHGVVAEFRCRFEKEGVRGLFGCELVQ